MKIRSRLLAAHADSAPFRYGPKETLVREQPSSTTVKKNADVQSSKHRATQAFAAGPRNTIVITSQRERAVLVA